MSKPPNRGKQTTTDPKHRLRSAVKLAALDGRVFGASNDCGKVVERYIICEAIAHSLIGKLNQDALRRDQLKRAIRECIPGCDHDDLIDAIFDSGGGYRNSKTPRQLRNPIVHQLNDNDILEATKRSTELLDLMRLWLDLFPSSVSVKNIP